MDSFALRRLQLPVGPENPTKSRDEASPVTTGVAPRLVDGSHDSGTLDPDLLSIVTAMARRAAKEDHDAALAALKGDKQ